MTTIPASAIVRVTPSVLSAGGTALDLKGLILTENACVPAGTVPSFPSSEAVAAYFGPESDEASIADTYFLGFSNSTQKPGGLLFAQYQPADTAAYLRGGKIAGLPLAVLQGLSGSLSVVVDGQTFSAASIDLSLADGYALGAALIGASIGAPVDFDVEAGAFVLRSDTTGPASSVGFATGTLADALLLTQATGAVTSRGAAASTPAAAMNAVVDVTTDWASFTTAFEPDLATKLQFASWCNARNNRYLYACWDTDVSATQPASTTCMGYDVRQSGLSGTAMVYADRTVAVFLMGAMASVDFNERNGRATAAFRGQGGIAPSVTSATDAVNLIANGYNYYGAYATANDKFLFLYPGSVSGQYKWIDSYINQIWLTNQLQLAIMGLLVAVKSIPYNNIGYALIEAACSDPIRAALNFGAIRPGVTLSAAQAEEVNTDAGLEIAPTLSIRGYYLQVLDASPQVRAGRGSPPCRLWYTDGGSVQAVSLSSIMVE